MEGWFVWVTIRICMCGPIRKNSYRDYKQRSVLFCRRPCSRRVCACVCPRCGAGWNNTTELRGWPYLCLEPTKAPKSFSSTGVFSSPAHSRTHKLVHRHTLCHNLNNYLDRQETSINECFEIFYEFQYFYFHSRQLSDSKIWMLIMEMAGKAYLYVCMNVSVFACVCALMAEWVIGLVISWWLKWQSSAGLLPLGCHAVHQEWLAIF